MVLKSVKDSETILSGIKILSGN